MAEILAVNIGDKRGTSKTNVTEARIVEGWGLEGDAHGGNWDRQVSVFPVEALEKVPPEKMEEVTKGGYTENITISGIPLEQLSVGRLLKLGEAEVEIKHIGKEEFKDQGRPYIVSREGRFCRVVKGGKVQVGDKVSLL